VILNKRSLWISTAAALAAAVALAGCGGSNSGGGGGNSPSISSFAANPAAINNGSSSNLTGVFTNGTGVITPGNLAATSGAAVSVSPTSSTTYTLTVTGSGGTTVTATTTVTINPLAITSFTVDNNSEDTTYGNLSWVTSGSTSNTTCALISEFGGDGGTTPLAQNPILGLPANSAPTYASGYPYPWGYCDAASLGLGPDNLTLTCSDPTAGTALKTIPVELDGDCIE